MIDSAKTRSDVLSRPAPAAYRALILAHSGYVLNNWLIAADNDEQAAMQARALVDGNVVELWDGLRFIEHYPLVG